MTPPITLAEILARRVAIAPHEAVAVAQTLLGGDGGTFNPVPPFGPPTVRTVMICEDGSVQCRGCATTPSVAEIAILLQAMLPAGALRVAGGLRYAVARALHEVSAPPFDSVDEFSRTLRRFERGNRDDAVRAIFSRARLALTRGGADAEPAFIDVDRRRTMPPANELRRQLREADQRAYELLTAAAVDEHRTRVSAPLFLCIAAGLALVMAGEFMRSGWSADATAAPLLTADSQYPPLTTNLPLRAADIRSEERMLRAGPPAAPAAAGPRPTHELAARGPTPAAFGATPDLHGGLLGRAGAKSRVRNPAERKNRQRAALEVDRGARPRARRPSPAGVVARIRFEWGEL